MSMCWRTCTEAICFECVASAPLLSADERSCCIDTTVLHVEVVLAQCERVSCLRVCMAHNRPPRGVRGGVGVGKASGPGFVLLTVGLSSS